MVLATLVGWSATRQNYVIPIVAMTFTIVLLFYLQGRVKEIIADERDYEVGGRAARLAITVFSWIIIIAMFSLLAFGEQNPEFKALAVALGYSVCLLLFLYAIFFRYYNKVSFLEKKIVYIIIGILLVLLAAVAGLRLISGEDGWICRDGQWARHGNPSYPMPTQQCEL